MNAKNPILIVAVGFVLFGGLFYNFGLKPKQQEAEGVQTKVEEAQARLTAAEQLLSSNTAAKKTFTSAYRRVVELGKAVTADDDVRSLVMQLDRAAESTHVDFQSIEVGSTGSVPSTPAVSSGAAEPLPPGVTVGPAGFPEMPFSFAFRGEFFRLAKFFQRLDAFVTASNDRLRVKGRLLTIESLKLEPDTTGFPNIKATVSAKAYLVSPLEGATGGATPAGPDGATTAPVPTDGTTPPTTTTATIR